MLLAWPKRVWDAFVADYSFSDPRTKDLPLMESIFPVCLLVAVYLMFCVKWGPRMMETRQPFDLKNTLFLYNGVSVVISVWMTYEALVNGWWNDYSFKCQPMDYSDNPKATKMAHLMYMYFVCKIFELLDTVFFVLRKKFNQVTVLHLYHHGAMPIYSFIVVKTVPGGSASFGLLLNCFVHSVMYSYYLLSGLGPQYQKYLWWKSHLTKLQLVQFVVILVQQVLVSSAECQFPKTVPMIHITNLALVTFLFMSFYRHTYVKPAEHARDSATDGLSCRVYKID